MATKSVKAKKTEQKRIFFLFLFHILLRFQMQTHLCMAGYMLRMFCGGMRIELNFLFKICGNVYALTSI